MASPKKLTPANISEAAQHLGVSVASIRAIIDIESRGDGFLPSGHPVILFERHVMFRQVRDTFGKERAESWAKEHPDLINPVAGGYGTTASQPGRMERAAELSRDCALQSASWGLFQIMGYHWKALGYASLQTFINAMYRDEAAQLFAFTRFIKINPTLHAALKNRDWVKVARLYNGPAYAAHNYHGRLQEAYAKHTGKEAA